MTESALATFIDRFTVQYVRVFPHPVERVWRALTEPAELGVWCMPATIDLRVGGAYTFQGEAWGSILALDPPRLIRFGKTGVFDEPMTLEDNYFQYELEATALGTRIDLHRAVGEGARTIAAGSSASSVSTATTFRAARTRPFHPGTVGGWHGVRRSRRLP